MNQEELSEDLGNPSLTELFLGGLYLILFLLMGSLLLIVGLSSSELATMMLGVMVFALGLIPFWVVGKKGAAIASWRARHRIRDFTRGGGRRAWGAIVIGFVIFSAPAIGTWQYTKSDERAIPVRIVGAEAVGREFAYTFTPLRGALVPQEARVFRTDQRLTVGKRVLIFASPNGDLDRWEPKLGEEDAIFLLFPSAIGLVMLLSGIKQMVWRRESRNLQEKMKSA